MVSPLGPPASPAGGARGGPRARAALRAVAAGSALLLGWLFGVWPPPVWWRSHWPRQTAMMERAHQGVGRIRPVPLEAVAPSLRRMVVIGEDSRFWTHHGIDLVELRDALGLDREVDVAAIRRAWDRRSSLRGASTITQQLAKNLYLSPSRSLWRKLKEGVTALRLEAALPKARILELYLNVAEWGPGVWGVDGASLRYFGRAPSALDDTEAAALAAALPAPRHANPEHPSPGWMERRDLILERYAGIPVSVPVVADSETDTEPAYASPQRADSAETLPAPPGPPPVPSTDSGADTIPTPPLDSAPGATPALLPP